MLCELNRGYIKASQFGKAEYMMYIDFPIAVTVINLLRETLSKLLFRDDIKAIQRTVVALGHMCVKEASSLFLDVAVDLIFSLSHSKVRESSLKFSHSSFNFIL